MKRNVDLNGLGVPVEAEEDTQTIISEVSNDKARATRQPKLGKVRISEGDAWYAAQYSYVRENSQLSCSALMYNHRADKNRVDVVDLDPYGTAAPFIDPAVQCLNDGGEYISI